MIKKGLAVAVILLFIGMCVVPSTAVTDFKDVSTVRFDGNTLYVGGSGPNNYTSIQSAIDDAVDGDTVFVYDDSSPYYENIVLEKTTIKLIGENRDTTIIDGNNSGSIIEVYSNDSIISGFTIQNSGHKDTDTGIYLRGGRNIAENNKLINNKYGIHLNNGDDHSVIRRNIICENDIGVRLRQADFIVTENYIYNNKNYGIRSYIRRPGGEISKNIVCNNSHGISQNGLGSVYIFGNIVTNHSDIGISSLESHNNTIESNEIRDNNYGVYIRYGLANRIIKNNFINNTNQSFFINYLSGYYFFRITSGKNLFLRNYWDDHNTRLPRLIEGKMVNGFSFINTFLVGLTLFGLPLIQIPVIETRMIDYDLLPASEPFDIEV